MFQGLHQIDTSLLDLLVGVVRLRLSASERSDPRGTVASETRGMSLVRSPDGVDQGSQSPRDFESRSKTCLIEAAGYLASGPGCGRARGIAQFVEQVASRRLETFDVSDGHP